MNTKERFLKVKAIFQEAMEFPAADRKMYVAHVCGTDQELRREVENLLNDEQAEAFSQAIRNQISPSLVGKTLDGRYRLEALIGEGGMGAVFRATDMRLRATVAVKIQPPNLSNSTDYVDRFLREAQAARMIQHPNVVTIHDVGTTPDGISYMVMEFIEGKSLSELLKEKGRFTPLEAVKLLEPVAQALHLAHSRGIVHRDVKPGNIMATALPNGGYLVKLLDLGIAKVQDSTTLTVGGLSMGTPQYMAPEQWGITPTDQNPQIDGRADIYSLGIVFFEMVMGKRPFEGDTHQVLFNQHAHISPPRLHDMDATIPLEISQVIDRTLAKDRQDRPATCESWVQNLNQTVTIKVTSTVAKPKPEPVTAPNNSHPNDPKSAQTSLAPTIAATPSSVLKDTVAAIEVDYSPPLLPLQIPSPFKPLPSKWFGMELVPGQRRLFQILGFIFIGFSLYSSYQNSFGPYIFIDTCGILGLGLLFGLPWLIRAETVWIVFRLPLLLWASYYSYNRWFPVGFVEIVMAIAEVGIGLFVLSKVRTSRWMCLQAFGRYGVVFLVNLITIYFQDKFARIVRILDEADTFIMFIYWENWVESGPNWLTSLVVAVVVSYGLGFILHKVFPPFCPQEIRTNSTVQNSGSEKF